MFCLILSLALCFQLLLSVSPLKKRRITFESQNEVDGVTSIMTPDGIPFFHSAHLGLFITFACSNNGWQAFPLKLHTDQPSPAPIAKRLTNNKQSNGANCFAASTQHFFCFNSFDSSFFPCV